MKVKRIIPKILYWLLFTPYILLTLASFSAAFTGTSFMNGDKVYGGEAYAMLFILCFLFFWYVFVGCLLGQIVILIIEKVKHKTPLKPYLIGMLLIYFAGDIMLFFS